MGPPAQISASIGPAARIILSYADDLANTVVAAQLRVSKPTVGKWRPGSWRNDCPSATTDGPSRVNHISRFGVNQFCRFTSSAWPRCWAALVRSGDVKLQDHGVLDHSDDGRGRGCGVGKDVLPLGDDQARGDAPGPPHVAFVQEQEVEVVQLTQSAGQVQVALGEEKFLHQTVGWYEVDGNAGFHPAVAQGAEGVGVAGAGQREGQDIDAAFDELAVGQLSSCWRRVRGTRLCSKVAQVLHEGSLDSRRSRLMRRCFRSSAPCSSTYGNEKGRKVGRAPPWPAVVKRDTDCAAIVGNLTWLHLWPMRSGMMTVSISPRP